MSLAAQTRAQQALGRAQEHKARYFERTTALAELIGAELWADPGRLKTWLDHLAAMDRAFAGAVDETVNAAEAMALAAEQGTV